MASRSPAATRRPAKLTAWYVAFVRDWAERTTTVVMEIKLGDSCGNFQSDWEEEDIAPKAWWVADRKGA
jgi:hypothetical protein